MISNISRVSVAQHGVLLLHQMLVPSLHF